MKTPVNKKPLENSKGGEERDKRKQVKHKAQQRATDKAMEAAVQMRQGSHSLGSYTGTAHDGGIPEQDADDL